MPSIIAALFFLALIIPAVSQSGECDSWQTAHPEWIFCDDFEDTGALVKAGRYFEYDNNSGDFVNVNGAGLNQSHGMRTRFQQAEVGAGSLKLAFGRNPNAYMNKQQIRPNDDFQEIYYRMYLKMQTGWQGDDPAKLSRATCFTSNSDWRQAMIAHLWSDGTAHLLIDPASCVNTSNQVVCTTYNDFGNLHWLGNKSGVTPVFSTDHSDIWYCIEAHVKLNDPGQSNGIQEFWIDGNLEAQKTGLNFVGSFSQYAINAVFFENYWNSGSVKLQERYFDNIVVSTAPIGPAPTAVRAGRLFSIEGPCPSVKIRVTGNSFEVQSTAQISAVKFYSSAGRMVEKHENLNSRIFIINSALLMRGVFFYTISYSENKLPDFIGKIVK